MHIYIYILKILFGLNQTLQMLSIRSAENPEQKSLSQHKKNIIIIIIKKTIIFKKYRNQNVKLY